MAKTLVITYLSISCYFLLKSLNLFKHKDRLSPDEIFLSLVVVSITTIFWPVAISASSTQVLKDKNFELGNVLPIIVVLVMITVSGLAAFAEAIL